MHSNQIYFLSFNLFSKSINLTGIIFVLILCYKKTGLTMNYKILLLLLSLVTNIFAQGFLRVDGKKIINDNGEIILKGIGLGGWMLMEGYMFKTSEFANAEYQIKEKIIDVIGEDKTEEFFDYFHQNFITEADIDRIAQWGFNSIRLPMHYNKLIPEDQPGVYLEKGFKYIDDLLTWCEKNELYLILDLHAAPGGQSDEPISDYNPNKPSLWESEFNKERTINLWREIARRYSEKEWIGGYDLINETKWDLGNNNAPLRDLMIRITEAIREVDSNHIVFIEGNWFATNFIGLPPAWDDNLVWSFHKYWNENSQSAIQSYLTLREQTNRPLWLGESGENSNVWFTRCIKLMEDNNIGWAWWPLKKIESIAGPLSAKMTNGYKKLLDYWKGSGSKPSQTDAFNYLIEQVDQLKLENCTYRPDVIDAMIRLPMDETSFPFKDHTIPGKIFFTDYDLGPLSVAYFDNNYHNIGREGQTVYNTGYEYRNDGVDIEKCSDFITNGYNVGWIESAEYLTYTVNIAQTGTYKLSLRISAMNSGGKILIYLDDSPLTSMIDVPVTGGWQNWNTLNYGNVELPAGIHKITVKFFFGGFNVNFLEFEEVSVKVEDDDLKLNFNLEQNYPNPFNGTTTINYSIPIDTSVEIVIYDSTGKRITTLMNEEQIAGKHSIIWETNEIASGVYFLSLKSGQGNFAVKKALLIK